METEQSVTVHISGGISAGKSTLVSDLSSALIGLGYNCITVPEDIKTWTQLSGPDLFKHDVLKDMYDSRLLNLDTMSIAHMRLQLLSYATLRTTAAEAKQRAIPGTIILLERGFEEAKECFLRPLKPYFTPLDYQITERVCDAMTVEIPAIRYQLALTCPAELCYIRMQKRGRVAETHVTLEWLTQLAERYEKYYKSHSEDRVLIQIDGSKTRPEVLTQALDALNVHILPQLSSFRSEICKKNSE